MAHQSPPHHQLLSVATTIGCRNHLRMECDRSWMQIQGVRGRQQEAYQRGVREFLDFAFKDVNPTSGIKLRCPCQHCQNYYVQGRQTMRFHLFQKGIKPDYNPWIFHGEEEPVDLMDGQMDEEDESDDYNEEDPLISDEMASLVNDMMNANDVEDRDEGSKEIPDDFDRLKKESEEPLYPGCKTYSKLSFIVTLLHLKVARGHWRCKNIRDAERACPPGINVDQWKWLVNYWNHPKQKERSEKNRINAMLMKIHSACGAKSTARNIYEIDSQINTTEASSSISAPHTQDNSEPKYIQLWNKTKRHANGKLNDEAKLVLIEFEKLHEKELAEKGIANLSIDEAYDIVLGHTCGYARGLERAHPVLQKGRRTTMSQMQTEIEQLRARELEMKAEMEQLRANAQKKEEEALEREDKIRAEFKAEMAKVQDFMDHFLS